jgi:hypothetical protein
MSVLRTVFPLASLILLALAGCKDTHITTYRIPKEAPARPVMAAAPNSDNVHWQAPAGWQERPGNGMRRASFQIAGADGAQADMAVTVFPGDVGGDLANVNRWRPDQASPHRRFRPLLRPAKVLRPRRRFPHRRTGQRRSRPRWRPQGPHPRRDVQAA